MKLNKHIHDEDYDFNIKLIVPLLTILVCTICLCATTWAWYTASVSTGVNSIKAGSHESTVEITYPANALSNEETISAQAVNNEAVLSINQDGYYEFDSNVEYKVKISNDGESTFGYHCMITVICNLSDDTQTSAVLYTGNFTKEPGITFTLNPSINCKIKIDTMWGNPPSEANAIAQDGVKQIKLVDYAIIFDVPSTLSLIEEDTKTPPPTYEYTIRFIDSDSPNYEIQPAITGSAPEGCISIEYNDYLKEGYELVISEDIEIDDDGTIWFEINPEEQVNEFKLFYKMIETNDAPVEDRDGGETTVEGDNAGTPGTPGEVSNNENGGTNTSTPSPETESNPESQNNQQSQVNNSSGGSDSDNGTSENSENVSSVEETIDTTSSSYNEGDVENISSSNDTDSGSDETSE